MDKDLSWTSALGDANLNQSADIMDAIQFLRKKAQDAGNLKTTPQQTVTDQNDSVIIQPADPQVVYVPDYDPDADLRLPYRTLAGILPLVGRDRPIHVFRRRIRHRPILRIWLGLAAAGDSTGAIEDCCTAARLMRSTATRFTTVTPTSTAITGASAPFARGDRGVRGFSAPAARPSPGVRSGAFGGFGRGGDVRGFSSRGQFSMGGGRGFGGGGFGGGARGGGGGRR